MPYIEDEHRRYELVAGQPACDSAELCFLYTDLADAYFVTHGVSYETITAVRGALWGSLQEVERRIAAPYERIKQGNNGDVFSSVVLWQATRLPVYSPEPEKIEAGPWPPEGSVSVADETATPSSTEESGDESVRRAAERLQDAIVALNDFHQLTGLLSLSTTPSSSTKADGAPSAAAPDDRI